ncbi:rated by Genemark [Lactococcus cremoris]|nr:rated by Genemark [Lactococcus cremoris]
MGIMNGILSVGQGFGGTYAMGDIGDVLDITNGTVVSNKYFKKHYSSK